MIFVYLPHKKSEIVSFDAFPRWNHRHSTVCISKCLTKINEFFMKKLMFTLWAVLLSLTAFAADEVEQTPEPEIYFDEVCYVYAYGEGEVHLFVDDVEVENPYYFEQAYEEYSATVSAWAQEEGKLRSETVELTIVIPAMERPMSPEPTICYYVEEEYVNVTVTGQGVLTIFVDGEEPIVAEGGYWFLIQREDEEKVIEVCAYAQEDDCDPSQTVCETIIVPRRIPELPGPYMSYTIDSIAGTATVVMEPGFVLSGDGEITMHYHYRTSPWNEATESWSDYTDWAIYEGELVFDVPAKYEFEAYNVISNVNTACIFSYLWFTLEPPLPPLPHYDFEEDGIYYIITDGNKVSVTENPEYKGYSGDIVIPSTVSHHGADYVVTAIDDYAFEDCEDVTSVSIGSYVTKIGDNAFAGCTGLTEVVLGDYVITVGAEAFSGCTALTKLTIGHGVRTIGSQAFAGCTSLATIICKPATPPVMAGQNCFDCYQTATLKVFPAVIDSYQSTNYWNQFANIVGEDTVSPDVNDIDGDGNFGINDITTLIDRLLGN